SIAYVNGGRLMRSRLNDGASRGERMLMAGRTLSRHARVPRTWQARILMEKRTGSLHASERPKPSWTKRANDCSVLRGSSRGTDDFSAAECVRSCNIDAPSP